MTEIDLTPPALNLHLAERALATGHRARAEAICMQLCKSEPCNPDVLGFLGRCILRREGYLEHASETLVTALALAPDAPDILADLAEAWLRKGEPGKAADAARKALHHVPDHETAVRVRMVTDILEANGPTQPVWEGGDAATLLLLGQSFNGLGRFSDSVATLMRAVKSLAYPLDAFPALMRGLAGVGQLDDALQVCRWLRRDTLDFSPEQRREHLEETEFLAKALDEMRPDHAPTLAILGTALLEKTRTFDQGIEKLNRAQKIDANCADYFLGAGLTRFKLGDFIAAEQYLSIGCELAPENLELRRLLTTCTIVLADRVINVDDLSAADLTGLGHALLVAGRIADADKVLAVAVEKDHGAIDARIHFATVLGITDRLQEALATFVDAAALAPEDAEVRSQMAVAALAVGRIQEGWEYYESRLQYWRRDSAARDFPMPQWAGEPLTGRSVFIWREEGIGDELRFSTCLGDFLDYAQDCRVTFECSARLETLYKRTFPHIDVVPEDLTRTFEGYDYHVPLLSLPRHFRGSVAEYPASGEFLVPDPKRVEAWQERLAAIGDGPKIGIGWKSGNKSWVKSPLTTELTDWDPLLARKDIHVINLQRTDWQMATAAAHARHGAEAITVFDDLDLTNDLEGVTALLSALDCVVGGRCWISTFAGAVGTPGHVASRLLNPYVFGLDYDPWTPTTTFHYARHGEDWSGTVHHIVKILEKQFSLEEVVE